MIKFIIDSAKKVKNGRDKKDVLIKAMEEMGEVSQEMSKITLAKYKGEVDKGKIISEIGDTIVALIDLADMIVEEGGFDTTTENILNCKIQASCEKWVEKYNTKKDE